MRVTFRTSTATKAMMTALVLCTLLCFGVQAQAAARTYVVLPFAINGPSSLAYLEDAIPSMLNSRLYTKGQTQAVSLDSKVKPATDDKAAKALMDKAGADYVVWGTVTAQGDNATVDMRLTGKDGKQWKRVLKSPLNSLIVALQRGADAINSEVFLVGQGKGGQAAQPARAPMNPAFVSNETTQRQAYLNPQFRSQGVDSARMRSQSLPFAAVGMIVADVTGDGKNEIVILDDHKVLVFAWGSDNMKPIGTYDLPKGDDALSIRSIDLNGDKTEELIINMLDPEQSLPRGHILSFKGKQFTEIARNIPYYMNVVKLPADFSPVLVGQRGDSSRIFSPAGIHQLALNGNAVVESGKLNLPKEANAINFAWIPSGPKGDGNKLVVLTKDEKIAVFTDKLARMATTDDKYSGSALGIDNQRNMPGLGKDRKLNPDQYYVPLRMMPVDIEKRGEYTLLVNKPISVSAQYFDRYRFYPEGEVHDLFWDGVGMSLLWKTRRIKGSVVDFTVADVANDGSLALVVCINTHPGALGFSQRKTVVLTYPLDLSQTDPNTPIVIEE